MKTGISSPTIVLLTLCLLCSTPLGAQTAKKWTAADIVSKARPGQWIELEGDIQKDLSVLVLEIKFLIGDFMDDDWELRGTVRAIDLSKSEFQILSLPVNVTKDTDFDNGIESLDDIKPDYLVEIEGTYLNNGTFLAKEIDNKTDKLKTKPQYSTMIEALGKVGQVDEAKGMITMMGIQFYITEKTEGKSAIK